MDDPIEDKRDSMKRLLVCNRLLRLLLPAVAALAPMPPAAQAAERPNIVLLYADDAGYADFGFQDVTDPAMQSLTPRIDSIAAAGARFTNAYMSGCVCSPSRAGMLTGRYQQRFGHELNIPPGYMQGGLPLTERTLANRLSDAGYATAIIGKWHLGYPSEYQPNQRGFKHFYGLLQGARGYFPLERVSPHRVIQENGKPTEETGYVTDRFGEAAVRYIDAHTEQPFFLFLSFTAPHGPLHAKPADLEPLASIGNKRRRTYAAMVKSMDENVGRVLDALEQNKLLDNTLVVFTNDNGGQTLTGAVNTPLRGRKGSLWEGGIRVPMAMQWLGKIAKGTVVDDPVISLDLTPTFLQAARAETPSEDKLDGATLVPRLTGKVAELEQRPLYWRGHGPQRDSAVRLGKWKLVLPDHQPETRPQLYDLDSDIAEQHDVASKHPERVAQLRKLLNEWESQLIDPLWSYPKRSRANQRRKAS